MKSAVILGFLLSLGSCVLLEQAKVEDAYSDDLFRENFKSAQLIVENLTVHKEFDGEPVAENAQNIVRLLAAKHQKVTDPGSSRYRANIVIKEAGFVKDYQPCNSVTLEILVKADGSEEPSFVYLLSDETQNTISSYKYLYRILLRAFNKMYQ